MDVNGTRFHLLLARDDWAGATPGLGVGAVVWNAERGGLALRPLLYRFPRPDALTDADRRGAARDGFGHFYHVGADEASIEIVAAHGERARWWPPPPEDARPCPPGDGAFAPAEPEPAPEALPLRGLAVTAHHYLVAAVPEPAQLLVFDLHAGGPPAVLPWPGPAPFRPLALAARPDGGVWLLEADPADGAAPARYWGLDRFFRLDRHASTAPPVFDPADADFAPETGDAAPCPRPPPLTEADGWPLEGRPVAIEGLPDGTVLVLEVDAATGATTAARYGDGAMLGRADLRTPLLDLLAPVPGEDAPPVWVGHDVAFVAEPPRRRGQTLGALYVVGQDGNQAFVFSLEADEDGLRVAPRETYVPLRLFGGRGLLADRGAVFYDLAEPDGRWLPVVGQPKPRYEVEGTVETRADALDGREPGCVWHRLVMDACLPAGAAVRVESRAADDPDRLAAAPWSTEPAPYLRGRGPELPHYRAFTPDELRRDGVGSWELLFQRAEGRYLQLRITLTGTGRNTPRVYAIRVHYPRFSYLKAYLPAVYREEEEPARFLDRFLANTEGVFTEIEGRIAGAEALFDERLLDAEYLDWLAGWFGTVLDPAFDEARRRLFLRHAVALYAERGTLAGLVRALRLALDPCPSDALFASSALDCDLARATCAEAQAPRYGVRVVERFLTRRAAGVTYGRAGAAGPLYVAADEPWMPAHGASRLHQVFRRFLQRRHGSAAAVRQVWGAAMSALRFPPRPPAAAARRADWRAFVADELTFTYAEVGDADVALYRGFLERRYRSVERMNALGGTGYAAFSDVPLPDALPPAEPRLSDWVQFASLVVPLQRDAARFDVLVPMEAGLEQAEQQRRLDFVRRLVEREKPAHTEFEVEGYWALFRVGEARLGLDTVLDRGSRYLPLLLPGALGAVTVGREHPWGVPDRFVAGRDRPGHPL